VVVATITRIARVMRVRIGCSFRSSGPGNRARGQRTPRSPRCRRPLLYFGSVQALNLRAGRSARRRTRISVAADAVGGRRR
jgi:hypothetical protein